MNDPHSSVAVQPAAAGTPSLPWYRTISRAQWKPGDLRVEGTASKVGETVSVRTDSATGPVLGSAVVTAAAPPATGGEYAVRLRNTAAGTSNPGRVWVTSTGGGVAGPVTVANR